MHDSSLEELLRRTLRDEGDALPFAVTIDRLEARLAKRRRATRTTRFALLGAAAVVAIMSGAVLAVLTNRDDETPGVTPSVPASLTPTSGPTDASTAPFPSATPSATSGPPARPTGAFGAPNEAVIVSFPGDDAARPERIDVALVTVDAGALETNLVSRIIAQFPGSTIPDGQTLTGRQPKYGPDGWLAIGVADGAGSPATLVYDLRSPETDPWLISVDVDTVSWGPGPVLADGSGGLRRWNALDRTSTATTVDDGVEVAADSGSPWADSPAWLASGAGFAVRRQIPELEWELGTIDLTGHFTRTLEIPDQQLVSGLERRWGLGGSDDAGGCPTEGGPPGCSVFVTELGGGGAVDWYTTDMGLGGGIQDFSFDAEGDGLWLVLRRDSEGSAADVLLHADEPGRWSEIVSVPATGYVQNWIVGLRDAGQTLDERVFVIGVPGSGATRLRAISTDGAMNSFPDGSVFAGWAGGQPAYPTR